MVQPPLTIADRAPLTDMLAAAHALDSELPVGRALSVSLMVERPSAMWECAAPFPLDAVNSLNNGSAVAR